MKGGRAFEPGPDDIERWLPAVGWPGYEVSNWGRARSYWVCRSSRGQGGRGRRELGFVPKILQGTDHDGYRRIYLSRGGREFARSIHVIVLEAFRGPRLTGMHACHNDGNPANNRLENLRWDTQSANQMDSIRYGRHNNAKLSETDIPAIWSRLVAGESCSRIAKDYGVSLSLISSVRTGKAWSSVTSLLPGWPLVHLVDPATIMPIYPPAELIDNKNELWRPITDWSAYRVSNCGRVATCLKRATKGRRCVPTDQWNIMKSRPNKSGHPLFLVRDVSLPSGSKGRIKTLNLHSTILIAFVCPRPPGMVACHNDGDPSNNHLGNLRWDTRRANALDRFRHARERAAVAS